MKKIYHLCLSSHREVLFRNEEDFTIGFNYLAEAAFYTESRLLADGFMSTHWHNIVRTEVPDELTARFRYAQLPADPGSPAAPANFRYAIDRPRISAVDVGDRFGGGRIAPGQGTKKG